MSDTSGRDIDKFTAFNLTARDATSVQAPLIGERYANFECRLHDDVLVDRYHLFIRSRAGACRPYAETSADAALQRQRRVRGCRQSDQSPRVVSARQVVKPSRGALCIAA